MEDVARIEPLGLLERVQARPAAGDDVDEIIDRRAGRREFAASAGPDHARLPDALALAIPGQRHAREAPALAAARLDPRGGEADELAARRVQLDQQRRLVVAPAHDDGDRFLGADVERHEIAIGVVRGQMQHRIGECPGLEDVAEGEREEFAQLEAGPRPFVKAAMVLGELGEPRAIEIALGAEAERGDLDAA